MRENEKRPLSASSTNATFTDEEVLRVALLQMCSQDGIEDNLGQAERLIEEAAAWGAELVVLPEACFFLGTEADKASKAEDWEGDSRGPMRQALERWSTEKGVWIIAGGVPERSPNPGRPFNTSVVCRPDGEIVGKYRKMHLFDVSLDDGTEWHESSATTPGKQPVVVPVRGVGTGLSICYDLRFPEIYAWQKRHGAQILTVPAAFTRTTGEAHWHALLRARAIESQCFVLAPAQEGQHPRGRRTYGHSLVIDPWGKILAERTDPGPGVLCASLHLAEVDRVRTVMPLDAHRRLTFPSD